MRLCVKRSLFSPPPGPRADLRCTPTAFRTSRRGCQGRARHRRVPARERTLLALPRRADEALAGRRPQPAPSRRHDGRLDPGGSLGAGAHRLGRDGLYEVPVDATDLVERGESHPPRGIIRKMAPNFVLAIAPRLVDSAGPTLRPYLAEDAARHEGFMAVFADPDAEGFAALAKALAPLSKREAVLTILFPAERAFRRPDPREAALARMDRALRVRLPRGHLHPLAADRGNPASRGRAADERRPGAVPEPMECGCHAEARGCARQRLRQHE